MISIIFSPSNFVLVEVKSNKILSFPKTFSSIVNSLLLFIEKIFKPFKPSEIDFILINKSYPNKLLFNEK